MKVSLSWKIALALLAMATVSSVQAAQTNVYINCLVDVRVASAKLAIEVSPSDWDLGSVAQGGVKDSWFGAATHGTFWVRNTGDTNAAIYITAETGMYGTMMYPDTKVPPESEMFTLAVATNITDVVPVWNVLNEYYGGTSKAGRYLRDLPPGEYMLYDLRFYAGASLDTGNDRTFRIGLYATSNEETP